MVNNDKGRPPADWLMQGPYEDGFILRWRHKDGPTQLVKPKWKVGDEIYAKETHAFYSLNFEDTGKWHPSDRGVCCHYRAGCPNEMFNRIEKWRPSIFMPRWASRYRARVTAVRCERLQSITEADAKAEGAEPREAVRPFLDGGRLILPYTIGYQRLWDFINGPGSWDKNPFVFCYTLERIK